MITKVLRNRAYLGEASLHRADRDRDTGRVTSRELLARRADDHRPLTAAATFRAVQLARPLRRAFRSPGRADYLLVGMLRCAGCRYLLRACTNGAGVRTYICAGQHGMGRCPAPAYAHAPALEQFVCRAVLALDDVDVAARERGAELDDARAAADELREQVRRLVGQLRRSRHPDLVQAELDAAESVLDAAERALADLEQRARAHADAPARSLTEILSDGEVDERRAVLAAYLDRIVVRRGTEPLRDRTLLLLRGQERAFEPLPARGRKVPLAPWPQFPARGALEQAG